MNKRKTLTVSWTFAAAMLAMGLSPGRAAAQPQLEIRDELMRHFETSMGKFIALANAMPPEKFTWSPGEGVMEVGQVYMHVARYNYFYPSQSLGGTLPAGLDMDGMEDLRNKEAVVRALEASRDWVRGIVGDLTAANLSNETRLYGRDVPGWAVLVQLVSHMNEHLGQSIAYARMNGIVPPWSR